MTTNARIREHVAGNASRYVELLKEACSIPSVAGEHPVDGMADWLEGQLTRIGGTVERLAVDGSPPVLVGTIPGDASRTLMIYNHYDVEPTDPLALWDSAPFEPQERDGRLFARGAADNKGDLVARLCAIETYREVIGDLPYDVKFFMEGEEEPGSPHLEAICRAHSARLSADDCVWEGGWFDHRGRPTLYFGCKGLLYLELSVSKLAGDQHSEMAGIAPSAAWYLVQALNSLRDVDGNIAIDGFFDDVMPPSDEDLELLGKIPFDEDAERQRLGISQFNRGLSGAGLQRELLLAPTANIDGILSGYTHRGGAKAVLPAEAMAKVDFRLVPNQRPADIAEKVEKHLQKNGYGEIAVSVLIAEHPSRSSLDSKLAAAVIETTESWFSEPSVVYPLMSATGPMHQIGQILGIPISSPAGVGRPDSRIHAPNENVRIDDFLDIVGYTAAYLARYGEMTLSSISGV